MSNICTDERKRMCNFTVTLWDILMVNFTVLIIKSRVRCFCAAFVNIYTL